MCFCFDWLATSRCRRGLYFSVYKAEQNAQRRQSINRFLLDNNLTQIDQQIILVNPACLNINRIDSTVGDKLQDIAYLPSDLGTRQQPATESVSSTIIHRVIVLKVSISDSVH